MLIFRFYKNDFSMEFALKKYDISIYNNSKFYDISKWQGKTSAKYEIYSF